MTVLISDPSAKTKRSDAVQSTLFVGGLNSKTTEEDVDRLFKPVRSSGSLTAFDVRDLYASSMGPSKTSSSVGI